MQFDGRSSNENLIKRLEQAIQSDKISHAYILEGSACIDKKLFAENFVKGILCHKNLGENCGMCSICSKIDHGNHEDIMYLSADGSSIKDAEIVAMQDRLKTKPFGDRNIVIIEDSDTMTLRAQNRLLKTLEEPPGKSLIILLSENMENLTQTIQSRCVKYRLHYFGSGSYDSLMEKSKKVADMALRREPFYRMKKETDDLLGSSQDVSAFLDGLQVTYRNMIIEKEKKISSYKDKDIISHIHAVETARKQIKSGVSNAYAIKNLLLKIGG